MPVLAHLHHLFNAEQSHHISKQGQKGRICYMF